MAQYRLSGPFVVDTTRTWRNPEGVRTDGIQSNKLRIDAILDYYSRLDPHVNGGILAVQNKVRGSSIVHW